MTTPPACARCGQPVGPADRFCPRCGADVSGVQASIATTVVQAHAQPAQAAPEAVQLDAVRQATLGEYEILGELGRGGMASVYLAHDIALDRRVAIKVMAPALLAGEGMAERFKREARTAASLSHPNIIPIYAVRESEHALFFVMKLIEGRPLDSIIHEIGPLPIPMVQAILHQVGAALGYAHKHGVVHRDVKAANVMVDSGGWAVVTDFGIAKVAEAHGLTMTGATVGTPSYMSPEQCDAKELTGASDQYSLGVVAYEMLTGRLPFTAISVMAIMYAHFHEPPPPITEVRTDVPAGVAAAVLRMLEKDPARRWPSMEAAVAAIGGAPLAPGDPVHVQLVTLASAGRSAQLARRISTPLSPTPVGRGGVGKTTNVAALSITPGDVTIAVGGAVQLTVTAKRRSGSTQGGHGATWASTHPEVVTVSSSGLATAVSAGVATVTATIENTSATATVTVTPAGARRRRAGAIAAGVGLVGLAGALVWLKPWAPGAALAPPRPVGLTSESAQVVQVPAPVPPPATAESTAGKPPLGKQTVAPRRNPRPAPPQRATVSNSSAVAVAPPRDTAPTVAPPVTPPPAQNAAPAPVEAAPPPPPPDPRPQIDAAIASYARALEAQDINAVKRVAPGLSAQSVQNLRAFFREVRNLKVTLRVQHADVSGQSAQVEVAGTYEYVQGGAYQSQPVNFRAILEHGVDGWRITGFK